MARTCMQWHAAYRHAQGKAHAADELSSTAVTSHHCQPALYVIQSLLCVANANKTWVLHTVLLPRSPEQH